MSYIAIRFFCYASVRKVKDELDTLYQKNTGCGMKSVHAK